MSQADDPEPNATEDRYHGFSLKSVCWGYREIFAEAIEGLFEAGHIGPARREVTAHCFELLKQADQSCFDRVLKEFLEALNPRTRWLMDLPGVFGDVVDLGRRLAESRIYYGIQFFQTLGAGGFGDSPRQVRDLLTHVRRLREVDDELAVALLKGYRRLIDRLRPEELHAYIAAGLRAFNRNARSGVSFMAGTLTSAEAYIVSLTRECRLHDVHPLLSGLLKALVGYGVEIGDLSGLDHDELALRGTAVVCMHKWLFLPQRIRHFDNASLNRAWYLLIGVVAAGMLEGNSFCRVHGHPDYRTCRDVVGDAPLRTNLFAIVEYVRVLRRVRRHWPGASRLIDFGLATEFRQRPLETPAEELFRDAMSARGDGPRAAETVRRVADASANLFDTASRLDEPWVWQVVAAYPGIDRCGLRAFGFLPDFHYPAQIDSPWNDRLILDLKATAVLRADNGEGPAEEAPVPTSLDGGGRTRQEEADESAQATACHVYDEWSHEENDYYREHCFLQEHLPERPALRPVPAEVMAEARRVRRVFERLKGDLIRRQKRLREGDVINPDLLLEYVVQRRNEPAPRIDFYEKPLVSRRDLAVLILLDASGSTGEDAGGGRKVLDVEKNAALVLGEALASLDDRFSICGFSSNGREKCSYFIYKAFGDAWGEEAVSRILSARPASSTRIGPALRHSRYLLSRIEARQRLIVLVTDGKPMDIGYDPKTRYAQYDVRMACEESIRQGIDTFGISTEANTLTDMEIMFPRRRFAVLSDIRQLTHTLPKLYLRLST